MCVHRYADYAHRPALQMYVHYNNRVLRPALPGVYVTTIHCINSAGVKLSKLQKVHMGSMVTLASVASTVV